MDTHHQKALGTVARGTIMAVAFAAATSVGTVFAQFRAESDLGGGDNVQGAMATNAADTAVGRNAMATGNFSTGVGDGAQATGFASTALGHSSTASGIFSTAIGDSATASNTEATALGLVAAAQGVQSTALGANSAATSLNSTAVGRLSTASNTHSTALGAEASATGLSSTAVGVFSTASGNDSTALGLSSNATEFGSTALGNGSLASGVSSTSVGLGARARGVSSTALGSVAEANGDFATALGNFSTAGFANSTAIGADSATTRDNQMMFGTASNTYTAPGITSTQSRSAQMGPREIVTSDAGGNLATDTPAGLGLATVGQLDQTTEGVAMAMAMSGVPSVLPVDATYGISANYGTFGGENAMAIGGAVTLTDNLFFNGAGAFGTGNNGSSGGARAGFTFIR